MNIAVCLCYPPSSSADAHSPPNKTYGRSPDRTTVGRTDDLQ
ncbi:hypothetical protein HMPREF1556_00624 [Porphyromonas sp. oral taxon 278 str. W7784]|nr:hypothetical protein HMPREF1556_00624 [Porphyromonas sp. oral taxon 278 str. W7784]